jgi:hypothetical protein
MRHPHAHRGSVNWDGLGAGVSIACAVHCAALPLVFGLLPGLQLALRSWDSQWHGLAQWLLWSHEAERVVVSTVIAFAAIVLIRGFLRHRRRLPLMVAMVAGSLMAGGAFGHWHSENLTHIVMQVVGGLGMAAAHMLNFRKLHAGVTAAGATEGTGLLVASAR